jgi:hypothetical protein
MVCGHADGEWRIIRVQASTYDQAIADRGPTCFAPTFSACATSGRRGRVKTRCIKWRSASRLRKRQGAEIE